MANYKILLAIGNKEVEESLGLQQNIEIIDSDSDIDIIEDVLNYENIDYVIVNTLLSESKSLNLAKTAKEKNCRVVAMVENHQQKEFIAAMVGLGVKAFVDFGELKEISKFINHYPKEYDFSRLQWQPKTKSIKAKIKVEELPLESKPLMKEIINEIKEPVVLPNKNYQPKIPMIGKITVAIFNICRGAGATQTAIQLAEHLAVLGQRVICVSLDKKQEFLFLNSKHCLAEYFIPESLNDSANFEYLLRNKTYQIIIYDFGQIFEIEPDGALKKLKASKMLTSEFMRCTYKIGLSFSDQWNQNKLKYFIENEDFMEDVESGQLNVIVSGSEDDETIKRYERLDIYKRIELDNFISTFEKEIGLGDYTESQNKKRKKRFRII